MAMAHFTRRNFKIKVLLNIFIYFAVCIFAFIITDYKIRPIIKTMSAYRAKVFSAKIINDAVYNELQNQNVNYGKIVKLTYGENGNVTSLQTDIIALNKLKTEVINSVVESIANMKDQEIRIPIGSLTGVQFLSGRGKRILFKIIPAGYVEATFKNKFDSAGINQTRHQIILNLKMTVTAIIPGYSTTTQIETDICMAETVIVGLVPEAFTEVLDSQDVTGKIFDYGAEVRD